MQQIWKVLSNGKIFIKIFLFFVSKTFIFDPTNSNEMNLGNILSGIPFSDKAIGMGSTKVWFVHLIFVELRHKTFKEPQRTCLNSSKAVQLGPRQSCWLCWRPVRGLHIITRTWRPDPDPHTMRIRCSRNGWNLAVFCFLEVGKLAKKLVRQILLRMCLFGNSWGLLCIVFQIRHSLKFNQEISQKN